MNDTSLQMSSKVIERIQQKSPEERLAMGFSTHDFSKSLVISGILNQKPQLALPDLRKEIFIRFYKNDFNLDQQKKILAQLG